MRTVCLIIEYDGTEYSGWQLQEGVPTVQGEIERAISELIDERPRVRAASRTDAGVHAAGQVVAFDIENSSIPLSAFELGLSSKLPRSIAVRSASEPAAGWDPKRSSRGKRYCYTFYNHRRPSPLRRYYSWHVPQPLDEVAMHAAAQVFVGTHDFESMRSAQCVAEHAVRTMYSAEVRREGDEVCFEIVGNAFVRNMVRVMAGTLRDAGIGKLDAERVKKILAALDRTQAGMTAPPEGLCLMEVIYDERLPPRPTGER